jgi:small subunit ribosomal protein S20
VANIKSAKKDVRRIRKRNPLNSLQRSRLRTFDKKVRSLVQAGKLEDARQAYKIFSRYLDRAGKRNLIHWKQADRRKSRMALMINRAASSASA